MRNTFYLTLNALFILKIFNFCLNFMVIKKKRLDKKHKFNFEIYDVTTLLTDIYNTHIAHYLWK